jgi:FkbM family methyltransferase
VTGPGHSSRVYLNFSGLSESSVLGRLLRKALQLVPASAIVPVLQGPLRGAWWITGSATHGCWLGSYESDKQLTFGASVGPGNVVYDVGANVGFYTLLASRLVREKGWVYSFEPWPDNVALLNRHLQLNHVVNVTVIPAAVAAKSGEMRFAQGEIHQQGRLSETGSLKVRVVSLDDLVLNGSARPPHVIKIDVEGAELDVIRGAENVLRTYKPIIFLATHSKDAHQGCCEFLLSRGYSLTSLSGEDLDKTDELRATPDVVPENLSSGAAPAAVGR